MLTKPGYSIEYRVFSLGRRIDVGGEGPGACTFATCTSGMLLALLFVFVRKEAAIDLPVAPRAPTPCGRTPFEGGTSFPRVNRSILS
jgi:hypothetical protein